MTIHYELEEERNRLEMWEESIQGSWKVQHKEEVPLRFDII
jgi:hypothetical protein